MKIWDDVRQSLDLAEVYSIEGFAGTNEGYCDMVMDTAEEHNSYQLNKYGA